MSERGLGGEHSSLQRCVCGVKVYTYPLAAMRSSTTGTMWLAIFVLLALPIGGGVA